MVCLCGEGVKAGDYTSAIHLAAKLHDWRAGPGKAGGTRQPVWKVLEFAVGGNGELSGCSNLSKAFPLQILDTPIIYKHLLVNDSYRSYMY